MGAGFKLTYIESLKLPAEKIPKASQIRQKHLWGETRRANVIKKNVKINYEDFLMS